jgi:hypothetical protein
MKVRTIAVIDAEYDDFIMAADKLKKINAAMEELCKGDSTVVWHGTDMKERRGDTSPLDWSKMKFRSN